MIGGVVAIATIFMKETSKEHILLKRAKIRHQVIHQKNFPVIQKTAEDFANAANYYNVYGASGWISVALHRFRFRDGF
jgi:hypothetical protein